MASTFTGSVSAATVVQPAKLRPELSLEGLVRRAKPAVVCLRSINASGWGFLVTETGIIATNAHVASGDSDLLTVLPGGAQLPAKVVAEIESVEIFVDGNFVGSPPATLKLTAGTHKILIACRGFPDYARVLFVPQSSVLKVHATLQPSNSR